MAVRRNRRLEVEVVSYGEGERELVMIRARVVAERVRRLAAHRHTFARQRNVAEHLVVRRVLLVDEDDVLDGGAFLTGFGRNGAARLLVVAVLRLLRSEERRVGKEVSCR